MWQATIYPMLTSNLIDNTNYAPRRGQIRASRKEARIELKRMVKQFVDELEVNGINPLEGTLDYLNEARAGESVYLWTADYGEEFAQAGVYPVHMNGA